MSTAAKISLDEFLRISETNETANFELDEGQLLPIPSPTAWHNEIRHRIHRVLWDFSLANKPGYVTGETDFLLSPDTVRRPDVAFIAAAHLQRIDLDRSPLEGSPALTVEVISPGNLAQDTFKKIHQYLGAGSDLVWIVYPVMKTISVHKSQGDS